MDFFIEYDNLVVILPVLPSSFEVTTKQNNTVANVVSLGEINLMGKQGLKSISFSSFFPKSNVHGGYKTSMYYQPPYMLCNSLENAKNKSKICRVIITESNVNFEALIDEFKYGVQDGSGDVEYTISFSEYRRPRVAVKSGGVTTLYANRESKEPEKTYVVKKGDTLKSIVKKELGSSSLFSYIAALNGIGAPYKVEPGWRLLLL